jgi:beta-1,4-mannosyl-glycoprotein beta-1,4-N-acetylglucosaminyltransferase
MFYNEFDMLRLRLHELYDVVDGFVVSECNRTMNNEAKPFYLTDNLKDFDEFKNKLVVLVNTLNENEDPWHKEFKLRNSAVQHIKFMAQPTDLVLVSNMDEIISADAVKTLKDNDDVTYTKFEQKLCYYWLNCVAAIPWHGPSAVSFKYINDYFKFMYIKRDAPFQLVPNGGFHFSYLGGPEAIFDKMKTFAHCNEDFVKQFVNLDWIKKCIVEPRDLFNRPEIKLSFVNVDSSYPKYIRDNIEYFKKYIYQPEKYLKI